MNTYSLSLSHTHTHIHTLTSIYILFLMLSHTLTHTFSVLAYTASPHTLSHKHTLTRLHSHSFVHICSLSLAHPAITFSYLQWAYIDAALSFAGRLGVRGGPSHAWGAGARLAEVMENWGCRTGKGKEHSMLQTLCWLITSFFPLFKQKWGPHNQRQVLNSAPSEQPLPQLLADHSARLAFSFLVCKMCLITWTCFPGR